MKSKTSKLLIAMLGLAMLVSCNKPSEEPPLSEEPSITETSVPTTSEPDPEPGTPIRLGTAADAISHKGELVLDVKEKVTLTYARMVEGVSRVKYTVEEGVTYDALTLYLENSEAVSGNRYTLTFKVTAAVAFVGILNGTPHDFVRGEQEVTLHFDEGEAPSLGFIFASSEEGLGLKDNEVSFQNFVFVERQYDSVEDIVIDASNSDWVNTRAYENTVGVHGITPTTAHKSVDFYATLTSKGLYLLADVQHDLYVTDAATWWQSSNFEFFINGNNQYWVSGKVEGEVNHSKSDNISEAAWLTTPQEAEGLAAYHTIVEAFVALDKLPPASVVAGEIRVGFAWKTDGDVNTGGEAAGGGEDPYWVPAGTWTNNAAQTFVDVNGIHRETQLSFEPTTLAIDGDLSDWEALPAFTNKVHIAGDLESAHKNVSFYAFINEEGLFVAARAEHDVFINDQEVWHMNTNFEFFMNGGNQNYVAANGNVSFGAGKIVNAPLGGEGKATYVTVAEAFIPAAAYSLDELNQFLKVGFAWKTNGDLATGLGGSAGGPDAWWFEAGHFPNNLAEQYFVTSDGVFAVNPFL
ncbi:MAG: hypothetical protein RBS24_02325 [Bacilli bacterium]|nr:hypothetical protein [Bacilli bacterium]